MYENLLGSFNFIFDGFENHEKDLILKQIKVSQFDPNEILIAEGSIGSEIFFLSSGVLEVTKFNQHINYLYAGSILGESSFFQNEIRTATVTVKKKSVIHKLNISSLPDSVRCKLLANVSRYMLTRQNSLNLKRISIFKRLIAHEKTRSQMSVFILYIISGICFYFFFFSFLSKMGIKPRITTQFAVPAIIFVFFIVLVVIKKSAIPLNQFGLNIKNWRQSLYEASILTGIVCVFLTILKLFLIEFFPAYRGELLFEIASKSFRKMYFSGNSVIYLFLYILFSPVQEFVARGCIQTLLYRFFQGKNRNFLSILLSNTMFGALHVEYSPIMSIVIFVLGFFWGWMFSKQKNIIGVSFSHIVIGVYGGWILGYL